MLPLIATNCACCGRELTDSVSIETGVGPECRRKHGFSVQDYNVSDEKLEESLSSLKEEEKEAFWGNARICANKIVYRLALHRSGYKLSNEKLVCYINILKEIGFNRLSVSLSRIIAKVECERVKTEKLEDILEVKVKEFDPNFIGKTFQIQGRQWDKKKRVTVFPIKEVKKVYGVLKECFKGEIGFGGKKGLFIM